MRSWARSLEHPESPLLGSPEWCGHHFGCVRGLFPTQRQHPATSVPRGGPQRRWVPSPGGSKLHGVWATTLSRQSWGSSFGAAGGSFRARGAAVGLAPGLRPRFSQRALLPRQPAPAKHRGLGVGGRSQTLTRKGPFKADQARGRCVFLKEAAGRERAGGRDVRGRAKHVAGAGELSPPKMGLPSRARGPVCRGAGREAAGAFPAGKWGGGDASPFAAGGDTTFWVSRAGSLLPAAAARCLCRKEEISRSGSSGSDGLKVSN